MVHTGTIPLATKGFTDIIDTSDKVAQIASSSGITNGLTTVFCSGSTGTVTTMECEQWVIKDLRQAIEKIAPSNIPCEHDKRWGDGNGFSHVRAAFMNGRTRHEQVVADTVCGEGFLYVCIAVGRDTPGRRGRDSIVNKG